MVTDTLDRLSIISNLAWLLEGLSNVHPLRCTSMCLFLRPSVRLSVGNLFFSNGQNNDKFYRK